MCNVNIILLTIITLMSLSQSVYSQEDSTTVQKKQLRPYEFGIGISVGTDLGGAVPVPLSNVPGIVHAYPDVNLSLGAGVNFPIDNNWKLSAEVTYNKISLDAKARVENQRFQDDDIIPYF